jgi:hypothetical protein
LGISIYKKKEIERQSEYYYNAFDPFMNSTEPMSHEGVPKLQDFHVGNKPENEGQ